MRFNFAMLFAIAATTQLATASPMPVKWNDKDMEAGYKFGAVACGVGMMICDKTGHPLAKDILQGGAYCCSTAAAAVTASQGPGFQAAAKKIGNAAVVMGNGAIAGGKYVGQCIGGVCKVVANTAKKVTGHRSIDGPELSARADNYSDEDVKLVARVPEPEPEIETYEDAVLATRYAEPEPEPDMIDFE